MGAVILTLRLMPDSPERSPAAIIEDATAAITAFGGIAVRHKLEPVAFGLNALNFTFALDESRGDTEPLEKQLAAIDCIVSVQVTNVTRSL